MPKPPIKLNIAKEFRLKYGSDMPTAKLARIMYEECPEAFTSIEHARTTLRIVEGKSGARLKKVTADKSLFIEKIERLHHIYYLNLMRKVLNYSKSKDIKKVS